MVRILCIGGGGGNRTRVRESSAEDVYMLTLMFVSRPAGPDQVRFLPDQPAKCFALSPTGTETRLSCCASPLLPPQEKSRETLALRG